MQLYFVGRKVKVGVLSPDHLFEINPWNLSRSRCSSEQSDKLWFYSSLAAWRWFQWFAEALPRFHRHFCKVIESFTTSHNSILMIHYGCNFSFLRFPVQRKTLYCWQKLTKYRKYWSEWGWLCGLQMKRRTIWMENIIFPS